MRIEAPEETLKRFAADSDWLANPPEVIVADLISSGNESRREWDTVCYELKDDKLFDPIREDYITNTDGGDLSQKRVNQELEKWFLSHESGVAVRISPSGGMYHYPDEQIEIYRITYEYGTMEKRLFGSLKQFHASFQNPEELRQFIFTENDSEKAILEIIGWVERVSNKNVEIALDNVQLRSAQAYDYAMRLKSGEMPGLIFQDMRNSGFLGDNPICGGAGTSSDSLLDSSLPLQNLLDANIGPNSEVWHDGTCRNCGSHTWVGPCSICAPCASKM